MENLTIITENEGISTDNESNEEEDDVRKGVKSKILNRNDNDSNSGREKLLPTINKAYEESENDTNGKADENDPTSIYTRRQK